MSIPVVMVTGTSGPALPVHIVDIEDGVNLTPPTYTATQIGELTAVEGMMVYNLTTHKLNVYTGAAWEVVSSST